jgi:hypothetical protein
MPRIAQQGMPCLCNTAVRIPSVIYDGTIPRMMIVYVQIIPGLVISGWQATIAVPPCCRVSQHPFAIDMPCQLPRLSVLIICVTSSFHASLASW